MSHNTNTMANPAPLGLLGFGMTTILLNLHNAGIIPLSAIIVSMGLMIGGFAQIIAGIMEFKTSNTFGATAFVAYGSFWWSLVAIWVLPELWQVSAAQAPDEFAMGCYLVIWCVFSFAMFIGTLKHNMITRVVFASLTILFLLLAIADFTGNHTIKVIAGYEGIFCGASALYSAIGQILNQEYGKEIIKL